MARQYIGRNCVDCGRPLVVERGDGDEDLQRTYRRRCTRCARDIAATASAEAWRRHERERQRDRERPDEE